MSLSTMENGKVSFIHRTFAEIRFSHFGSRIPDGGRRPDEENRRRRSSTNVSRGDH